MSCIDCIDIMEPPPDMIISMPPPPLPSFLLPKSSVVVTQNITPHQPCFAPFMCELAARRDFTGIEFYELSRKDDTWLYISVAATVGAIALGSLLVFIVMKCKKYYKNHYRNTSNKHPPVPGLDGGDINGHGDKPAPIMHGTVLYPFVPSTHYQSAHGADNRMLWATLTPHGTRHFVSETYIPQDDHYEIVDYHRQHGIEKQESHPTPLMDAYNTDDIDSGYQEPHNLNGSLYEGSLRGQYVSSPTYIENPNMAPLNMYQQQPPIQMHHDSSRHNLDVISGTLTNKKGTISRRISDLPTRNAKV